MNSLDKYKYWVMLSNYDLETIPCLMQGERWVYVAYLCQQAVERQLKGMYVYHMEKEAPKTHNIGFLFKKITEAPALSEGSKCNEFNQGAEACEDFLIELMFYYMSDYPFSYKNIKDRFISRESALSLYERTQQILQWLRWFQEDIGSSEDLINQMTEE